MRCYADPIAFTKQIPNYILGGNRLRVPPQHTPTKTMEYGGVVGTGGLCIVLDAYNPSDTPKAIFR